MSLPVPGPVRILVRYSADRPESATRPESAAESTATSTVPRQPEPPATPLVGLARQAEERRPGAARHREHRRHREAGHRWPGRSPGRRTDTHRRLLGHALPQPTIHARCPGDCASTLYDRSGLYEEY